MPAGFAPFGIANLGGQLYVTYAKQSSDSIDDVAGVGNGFVDVFNPDGSLARRFVSNGNLNSPWAVVWRPAGFGPFSGAFSSATSATARSARTTRPPVRSSTSCATPAAASTIGGLWGLTFGPSAGSTTLYFAAGIDDETERSPGHLDAAVTAQSQQQ